MGLAKGNCQTEGNSNIAEVIHTDSHQHSRSGALPEVEPFLRIPRRQYLEDRLHNARNKLSMTTLEMFGISHGKDTYLADDHKSVCSTDAERFCGTGITYPGSDDQKHSANVTLNCARSECYGKPTFNRTMAHTNVPFYEAQAANTSSGR